MPGSATAHSGPASTRRPSRSGSSRAEIARRGLADRIKVVECDFREMPGQYDKLLSIGTLEHAGRDQVHEVVRAHADALKPGGLGVIHFIGHVGMRDTEFYIRKHIFPGGWIPSLAEAITAMEACGLEVLDVENLRRHYALTLDCWAERFDENWDAILDARSEPFRRALPPHLAHLPVVLRRDVPLAERAARTCSRSPSARAASSTDYPMSRGYLYRPTGERPTPTRRRSSSHDSPPRRGARGIGVRKSTSNLFRDRGEHRAAAASTCPISTVSCASTPRPGSSRPRA